MRLLPLFVLLASCAFAAEKPIGPSATMPVSEFLNDEIGLVLRSLARQANMSIVLHPGVVGKVSLRLENKTPRQVIEVICQSQGYLIEKVKDVYHVRPPNYQKALIARDLKRYFDALLAEGFTREEALQILLHRPALKTPADKTR